MKQPMWDSKAVKAYETGQGVELVNEPHPHYVPSQAKPTWVGLTDEEIHEIAWPNGNETLQAIIKHSILQAEQLLKDKNT